MPLELMPPEFREKTARFEYIQRQSKAIIHSDLLPKQHRDNFSNLIIIAQIADRLDMDSLMVAQNLYIIQSKPVWSSPFLIALIRKSGLYRGIKYNFKDLGPAKFRIGEKEIGFTDKECQVSAIEIATGDSVEGPPVTLTMAYAEGWITKEGSKWKTLPDLMLRYRAMAFFARTVCPEVVLGLQSADEVEDFAVEPTQDTRKPNLFPTPEPQP
jgi:hypothetical protein